jgi:hypothetical protein
LSEDLPFSTFNSRQLDEKLQLYSHYVKEFGPPDVLIMGSSRALRGVDPAALSVELAELGYTDVKIFNFGINGATAQVVNLILQQLLTPDQLPKLILWADGARAFNSGTVDITFNGVVASEGYREVASGKLPTLTASDVQPANNVSAEVSDVTVSLSSGIGSSLTASYQDMDRWMSQRLSGISAVHEERDRLKHLIQNWLTGFIPIESQIQPISVVTTAAANTTSPTANHESPSLLVAGQDMMDLHGFLSLAVRFNPATYYQKYARVSGQYDSDYEAFRVIGKQAVALQSILQFTQEKDIPLVFVNLPLTQEYLDPVRLQHEQEFKQYMLSVAVNHPGMVFRDLSEQWLTNYDYFSDPSHLNRYGAFQVSHRLAQDPMIPWFQPDSLSLEH